MALEHAIEHANGDKPTLIKIALALIRKAEKGNIAAIREIADRLDGKVPMALVGDKDSPLTVAISWMSQRMLQLEELEARSEVAPAEVVIEHDPQDHPQDENPMQDQGPGTQDPAQDESARPGEDENPKLKD